MNEEEDDDLDIGMFFSVFESLKVSLSIYQFFSPVARFFDR